MIDLNVLNNVRPPTDEEWKAMCKRAVEEHISWQDQEAIADQIERMGGGNLIGRPSPYENVD